MYGYVTGYLMPKPSLLKNSSDIILFIGEGYKLIHIFQRSICPKVDVKEKLEFEHVVKLLNRYAARTPLW